MSALAGWSRVLWWSKQKEKVLTLRAANQHVGWISMDQMWMDQIDVIVAQTAEQVIAGYDIKVSEYTVYCIQ